jgi:hypothetical protein
VLGLLFEPASPRGQLVLLLPGASSIRKKDKKIVNAEFESWNCNLQALFKA